MNPTQDIPKSETIDITNQPRQSTGSSTASLETIGDLEKKNPSYSQLHYERRGRR